MNERESAEIVALQALGWLVSDSEMIGAFLGATGLAQGDIAALTRDPVFLAGVVDFCLESDDRVLTCAVALGVRPEAIAQARRALPGGGDPHWT
ncbi:DUF3572 domain-containing protein [Fuscibacter oryzae]|uniref:DUF3572 domain-containing protein n=1 Tax=Fuscibacter oryzae TaxID=2803939 RepID=A0A8J7MUK1_9RHOB|nr:DUF3572 domain-containing protein [Fuscibacter oryzae]MBL4929305.1 DUF3572 domain-containing protein [Fuscibacter oryzae]